MTSKTTRNGMHFGLLLCCAFETPTVRVRKSNIWQKLAEKYFETKFAKINVDKAKFFVTKLQIKMLPAVLCFQNGNVTAR